jgi:hypothetical protein
MMLMNALLVVGAGLRRRHLRRFENSVFDVAAADVVEALGEYSEIDIIGQGRFARVQLHFPDEFTRGGIRHFKQNVSADAPLERRVKVGRQVGSKNYDATELFQFFLAAR